MANAARLREVLIQTAGPLFVTGLLGWAAGCSSEEPTYGVRGQIVYADNGQPVPGGVTIVLESTKPPHARASGDIDSEGRFELSTRREGDGAIEGEQRVRFTAPVSHAQPDPNVTVARVMDPKYADFASSGLTVNVSPTDDNDFTLKVDRSPKGVQVSSAATPTKPPQPDRSEDSASILSPDLDVE